MKKEDIDIWDIHRLLHGELPAEFYLELFVRAFFVFLLLTFSMKYLGKRLISQFNRTELAAMSTLAASTGLIIMSPDRGLLPPLVSVAVIIFVQRFIHRRSMKSEKFEFATEGHLSLLVSDGVLELKAMKATGVSREQLFAVLRGAKVVQLGEIKRAYLEANGDFSVVRNIESIPGIPVIPGWDTELLNEFSMSDVQVCVNCGTGRDQSSGKCKKCSGREYRQGVYSLEVGT